MSSLKNLLVGASLALLPSMLHAQDIFIGVRGPTSFQIDARTSYSHNNKAATIISANVIPKYWNNQFWAFVNVPYKFVKTPAGATNGIGDVTIGAGPRVHIGNFNALAYGALTLPTGSTNRIPLGNNRTDVRAGIYATYFIDQQKYELDAAVERTWTGLVKGINPQNEWSAGILGTVKLFDHVRFGMGPSALQRTEKSITTWNSVLRIAPSKEWHVHFRFSKDIDADELPEGYKLETVFRYNIK